MIKQQEVFILVQSEGVVGSVVSLVDKYFLYNINKTYNVSNCQEQSYIFEISKNKSAVSEIIIRLNGARFKIFNFNHSPCKIFRGTLSGACSVKSKYFRYFAKH